jgi:hypothetical protein
MACGRRRARDRGGRRQNAGAHASALRRIGDGNYLKGAAEFTDARE